MQFQAQWRCHVVQSSGLRCWDLERPREQPRGFLLLPPPALRECRHRGLACGSTVGRAHQQSAGNGGEVVARTTILPHSRAVFPCNKPRRSQSRQGADRSWRHLFPARLLVRIEQQLAQGDENNDADNRRKEYGREGEGRFQHPSQHALSGRLNTMQ
jgi:hypothetical protein